MAKVSTFLVINQPREKVYQKAKDIENLANFLPNLKEVKIINQEGNRVESFWRGEFQGREIKWWENDWWDDANWECRFESPRGDFKQYQGVWRFALEGEGKTRVELEIEYDLGIPLVGALISNFLRKTMLDNAEAMLQGLQQAVES
ncbi:MAG: hypothetical protein PWP04_1869 [Candidatus Atribacteria bacterium]|nr:hypothetical protein [Candidatus Atribacteria bacterium]